MARHVLLCFLLLVMYSCILEKCVSTRTVSLCVANTPDRWKDPGPSGDQFPQSVVRVCSLLWTEGNNTPQLANFICCHFLSFSRSHCCPPPNPPCPTRPPALNRPATSRRAQCHTPVKHRLVALGFFRVSELSLLPGTFLSPVSHLSTLWVKINDTSWFLFPFFGNARCLKLPLDCKKDE